MYTTDKARRPSALPVSLLILLVFFLPFRSHAQSEASARGHWEGVIEVPGKALQVGVDLDVNDAGAWHGEISIPAQGAKNLPLEQVTVDGRAVSFAIAGVPGQPTFRGELAEDGALIAGQFTQSGQTFPFRLERGDVPAAAAEALEGFDALVEQALEQWHVPGVAVAVVSGGETLYAKGFGYRDLEAQRPMTADTLLPIGSCTKAFTTFVMGTLVDEGKLDWDEPVQTYIPWFKLKDPVATAELTARDMVTHRSGLPRHDMVWYNDQEPTRRELVERLRYLEPSAELRERFQYNNLMYMAAGFLVEEVTGETWEEAVRGRILDPLEMSRTTFADADSQKDDDFAWPYREKDEVVERIPFREVGNMGPAGAINSSVSEMSRWMIMLLSRGRYKDEQLISGSTLRDIMSPQMVQGVLPVEPEVGPGAYAMGWGVDSYRGHLRLSHAGGIDGFVAQVTLLPNDGLGIVVLSNSQSPLPRLLALHLMDRLLGEDARDWLGEALAKREQNKKLQVEGEKRLEATRVRRTKPSHDLDAYAGVYANPGYGKLVVEREGKRLAVTYNHIRTPFEHWHYDVFNGLEADDPTFKDMKIRFHTDVNGNINSASLPLEPLVGDIVFERQPDPSLFDPEHLRRLAGKYELGSQTITITLKGTTLFMVLPGQPMYKLEPAADGSFVLERLNGFRVTFSEPGEGRAEEITIHQPNGLFTAKRIE